MNYQRLVIGGLLAVIMGLLFYFARPYFEIERWVAKEQWLRQQIGDHPISATLLGLLVYFVASLVPGTGGKAVACGWFFGFWRALVISSFGLAAAGTTVFLLSRYFLRDTLPARWDRFRQHVDRAIDREGGFYLFSIRVLHVPYSVVNYVMGTTSMRVSTFWWATQLGMLPATAVFVYLGSQLPTLADLSRKGSHALLTPETFLALALLTVVPFAGPYLIRRFGKTRAADDSLDAAK